MPTATYIRKRILLIGILAATSNSNIFQVKFQFDSVLYKHAEIQEEKVTFEPVPVF